MSPVVWGAPYSNETTSREAAESMGPHLERLEALVLAAVREAGGATAEQVCAATGLRSSSVTARIHALVLKRRLENSGERRRNTSGRSAAVWRVVE